MTEHSQHKSEHKLTFLNRLERLRLKTGATWAAIAEMIGLSRTMLHHLRSGEKEPSQKTVARLEQAEINVGLGEPSVASQGILHLLETTPLEDFKIGPSDHDAGVVQVRVEFRRGSTPPGFDCVVPVKAPNAALAAKLLSDLLKDEAVENYIRQCLPPQFASDDFLNRLEPTSFLRLIQAALEMSLGANWRERLRQSGSRFWVKKPRGKKEA